MDTHVIQITCTGGKFDLPELDPDRYSTIELMRDYMDEVGKQPISPPENPVFFYTHPKSKKEIEICNDKSLTKMFTLFTESRLIHLSVRGAVGSSILADMWRQYVTNSRNADEPTEYFHLSPPPLTQPSTQEAPLPIVPPQSIVAPSAPVKRTHKKKAPRGLNKFLQLTVEVPTPETVSQRQIYVVDAPIQSVQTSNSTPRSIAVCTPTTQGDAQRKDVMCRSTLQSTEGSLECGDGSANNETAREFDDPTYSDDSWCHDDEDIHDMVDTDSSISDGEEEHVDDDGLEDVENVTDTGYFSADEGDCGLEEPSYLRNGTRFEYQQDGKVVFQPHQMFENKKIFLEVMKDYACQEGIDLHRKSNDPDKYTVLCNNTNTCPWRLHASVLLDKTTFMIKRIRGEHNCMRIAKNPNATVPWITKKILPDIRANKKMVAKDIKEVMRQKYSVVLNYTKCYRARNLALKIIDGNHDKAYTKIPQYWKIALERNPGSIIDLQIQEYLTAPPTFSKMFVCFHAQKEGFLRGCRPFIGVDGCHLKGPYGGVLLTAISIDGNNCIFPLAFAVVQSESTSTWKYFFNQLRNIADEDTRKQWVIISDRQKGVEPALREELSEVTRRICCRHLYANFKKDYPGPLMRSLFWEAAKAYTETSLEISMKKIKDNSVSAFRYLKEVDFDLWVRYHISKYAKIIEVTSNFVESFNSKLFDIRGKPILAMLDELRRSLMTKMHKRRVASVMLNEQITTYAAKILRTNNRLGRSCGIKHSSEIEFEAIDVNGYFIVNLRDRHCDCMAWDLSGIPCKHACAVIGNQRLDLRTYLAPCFSKEMYVETYKHAISPIPDPNMWPANHSLVNLRPPFLRKLPGRPKKNRRREQGEAPPVNKRSTHITCSTCKRIGHNAKTCASRKDRDDGPQSSKTQVVSKGKRKRASQQ